MHYDTAGAILYRVSFARKIHTSAKDELILFPSSDPEGIG